MAEIVLGIFVYGTFAFHCIAAYIPFGIERRERKPSRPLRSARIETNPCKRTRVCSMSRAPLRDARIDIWSGVRKEQYAAFALDQSPINVYNERREIR